MDSESLQFILTYALCAFVLIACTALFIFIRRPSDQQKIVDALNYYQAGDWWFDSTTNTYRDNLSTRFHRAESFENTNNNGATNE